MHHRITKARGCGILQIEATAMSAFCSGVLRGFTLLSVLVLAAFASAQTVRRLDVSIGTGNDDLRENSRVELIFHIRGQANFVTEVAGGRRWVDRTQANMTVTLPRDADIADMQRIDIRFTPDRRPLMEDDKWEMTSVVVTANVSGRTVSIYGNRSIVHKFERQETWSTGTLPGFRATSGMVVQVVNESGAPMGNASVFLGTNSLGVTDRTGQLNITNRITSSDALIVRARVHEQDYYRSQHSFDSRQNWNYRVYLTNLSMEGSGRLRANFSITGDQVRVIVRRRQPLFGLNFLTSLEWDAAPGEINMMRTAYGQLSSYLYNATDGQFFVETVTIIDQGRNWDDSDFRVFADMGYRANVPNITGGFLGHNVLGSAMKMSRGDDFKVYTHEFGHFGLDVRDEYRDFDNSVRCTMPVSGTTGPFAGSQPQASCMMWNQWGAEKICSTHASNPHVRGTRQGDTACWDKIDSRWSRAGSWELQKPTDRTAIPGRVMLGTTAVSGGHIQPRFNILVTNRPGLKEPMTVRVVGSTGAAEAGASVWLATSTGPIFQGMTDAAGNLMVSGAHTSDQINAQSADGAKAGNGTVGSAASLTVTIGAGSTEESLYAQTRPGNQGGINAPKAGPAVPLAASVGFQQNRLTVTVSTSRPLKGVPQASAVAEGTGKTTRIPLTANGSNRWTGIVPVSGAESHMRIYVEGESSAGLSALGQCAVLVQRPPTKTYPEVFGPSGHVALTGLRADGSAQVTISQEAPPAALPSGWKLAAPPAQVDGTGSILAGAKLEMRAPANAKSMLDRSINPASLTIFRWDDGKKAWNQVSTSRANADWKMAEAKLEGPGVYAVMGRSGNQLPLQPIRPIKPNSLSHFLSERYEEHVH